MKERVAPLVLCHIKRVRFLSHYRDMGPHDPTPERPAFFADCHTIPKPCCGPVSLATQEENGNLRRLSSIIEEEPHNLGRVDTVFLTLGGA